MALWGRACWVEGRSSAKFRRWESICHALGPARRQDDCSRESGEEEEEEEERSERGKRQAVRLAEVLEESAG